MLNKDEEIGLFQIAKDHFPELNQRSLVIGLYEFLSESVKLQDYLCVEKTAKQAAAEYAREQKPYLVFDESEGYKCLFFKGVFIKAQYDVTNSEMIHYVEESESTPPQP